MEEEIPKRGRGRPRGPTGTAKEKRNVRIGAVWERGEQLAAALGITMTAYVEDALRRHNARTERQVDTEPGRPRRDT